MARRNIKFQTKYSDEIAEFCFNHRTGTDGKIGLYPEHNDHYLKQCLYNLEEKYDRRIISEEEWEKIQEFWIDFIKERLMREKNINDKYYKN